MTHNRRITPWKVPLVAFQRELPDIPGVRWREWR